MTGKVERKALGPTRPRRAEHGQDAAEFALILPVLFFILMGIFDMGRATYYQAVLFNVTREAARYGIIYPEDVEGIETLVDERALGIAADELTTTVTYPDGETIMVTVEYDMTIVTPLVGFFFGGNSVTLGSQAAMRIEQ